MNHFRIFRVIKYGIALCSKIISIKSSDLKFPDFPKYVLESLSSKNLRYCAWSSPSPNPAKALAPFLISSSEKYPIPIVKS